MDGSETSPHLRAYPLLTRVTSAFIREMLDPIRSGHSQLIAALPVSDHSAADRVEVTQVGGHTTQPTPLEAMSAFAVHDDILRQSDFQAFHVILADSAKNMAAQVEAGILAQISASARANNMVIDGQGQRLSVEHIIQMLERMNVAFDAQGRPELSMVADARTLARIKVIMSDPASRQRIAEVLERKRREWLAR